MSTLKVVSTTGTDNIETFQIFNEDATPYSLATATKVEVKVCNKNGGKSSISSDDSEITYSGNTINVNFGSLVLKPGVYYPKIMVFDATNINGVVVAGEGRTTVIQLTVTC